MRKLVEYRQQKALHHQLMKAADCSMLGIAAIVMLYHCAKVSVGDVLEVGKHRRSNDRHGHGRPRFSHGKENHWHRAGCRVDHPRVGTKDSFKDLMKNLK